MKTIHVEDDMPVAEALEAITDEWIDSAQYCDQTVYDLRDRLREAQAKLSERRTVHEWLNTLGTPREENGKPLCLLRRLAITLKIHV